MSEGNGQQIVDSVTLIERVEKLCKQGRFVESKMRQVESEREFLAEQASKLCALTQSIAELLQRTQSSLDDRVSLILHLADDVSAIAERLNGVSQPLVSDNVQHICELVDDRTPRIANASNVQADTAAARLSMHMLCMQARYIVAYLERAIGARDTACLPRLADDLKRIAAPMKSEKLRTICAEFLSATASHNWNSIKLLHKALEEELAAIAAGSAGMEGLAKAS